MNTSVRSSSEDTARRRREMEHDRRIAASAGEIWGWETPAGRLRVLRRISLFNEVAPFAKDLRVLELGCGIGIFTEELARSGAELVAIDLSQEFMKQAQKRVANSTVRFFVQDAENLAFPDETFDCVAGVSVLHHLRIESAIREIYRVLRPNGSIIFSEPNLINPIVFLERRIPFLRERSGTSPDETAFVRWRLRGQLLEAGFQDVVVTPFDFLHPRTPSAWIPFVRWLGQSCERLPLVREISGSLFVHGKKPPS